MSKLDPTITFPTPSADWGTVTHAAIPNPARRWWAPWRPRAIVIEMPRSIKLGPGLDLPALTGTAVAPVTLKLD
jgi:hypothetical protein